MPSDTISRALSSIPTHLHQQVEPIREQFLAQIAQQYGEETTSPLLPIEIPCLFITYISTRLETARHQELANHIWLHCVQPQVEQRQNIHIYAASEADVTQDARRRLISTYYTAKVGANLPSLSESRPALIRSQAQGASRIHAIFGGQGNNKHYFNELCSLYQTYQPFLTSLLEDLDSLLQVLSRDPRISHLYSEGLRVKQWLEDPESAPSADYLITAPLSFPLIGLLQLATLKAICLSLDGTPADFPGFFHGLAGHSQGVVVAAAVATTETWDDYEDAARKAVTILFWIGTRSQQSWRHPAVADDLAARLEEEGHGKASPMLSISNLEQRHLDTHLARLNRTLPAANHAHIALVNSASNFVVSGPERTLAALIASLKAASAKDAQSQARMPYSQRKPSPAIRFLPITIPCHCALLDEAVPLIEEDLQGLSIRASELRVPVNNCHKGSALQSLMGRVSETRTGSNSNLVPLLVRMITSEPVFWAETDFSDATHILDFGPGGTSGVGALTHRNIAGAGARVLIATKLEKGASDDDLGSLYEVFSHDESDLYHHASPAWGTANLGSIVQTASGPMIATKLSRLLGLPPFFVAGMTPTTTHPEFVAAVMNAGYHIEFAAGGYHNASGLRKALYQLRDLLAEPGRGITLNVIYVSPKAIAWQIPLIRQLRAEGFPVTGLTVGGGVPSPDVASEYISTLGMRHISFKPGSTASIRQVVEIARRHPEFPVILQWTGGRGGGHHSAEDFHAPILETYAEIRACKNIALVAGSGFGCADDVIPYMVGDWSLSHGRRVRMPFDGVLLGSRVMTCTEALTSPGAKAAIAAASGVEDQAWEGTYRGPTGGIVSVVSEMGEPIHVVATRGAQFWAEMDKAVFSLEKKKRGPVLSAKKDYIVSRLNADFQRPWFGRKTDGRSCDVADMTYGEVCERVVELMFIGQRGCWIDPSYSGFLAEWILRVEERFSQYMEPIISDAICRDNPTKAVAEVKQSFPEAAATQVFSEDAHYFMQLCRRPGQKPVPFIPALDDSFETWFKKDSLWQSENVEAVIGQDAGRTFILHGPVAARQTCQIDEPVADVLNGVNHGVLQHMLESVRGDLPREEFLQSGSATYPAYETIVHGSAQLHPNRKMELLSFLTDPSASWLNALLGSPLILRGRDVVENPVRRLAMGLQVSHVEFSREVIRLFTTAKNRLDVEICRVGDAIRLAAYTYVTGQSQPVSMLLSFEYRPQNSFAPISEVVHDRNERISAMYRQLWTSASDTISGNSQARSSPETAMFDDAFIIEAARVRAFSRAIGYAGGHLEGRVPMDFAIVAVWSPICKALLQEPVQGDVLNLVHLSNAYEMANRGLTTQTKTMQVGEELATRAYVNAITIDDSGKTVEVVCEMRRPNGPVFMKVCSRFLFRGAYTDHPSAFARKTEPAYEVKMSSKQDIAVIAEKPWFHLEDKNKLNDLNLTDLTLEFHLQTFTKWTDAVTGRVDTSGRVFVRSEAGDLTPVAIVKHSHVGDCRHNNVVLSYLERHGRVVASERQHLLPAAATTHISQLTVPASNEAYSRASGDFNPIHTSSLFADLVDLPGTITHGMYCSAAVRCVVEKHMADQDPRRIKKYDVSFVGMVLPNDVLQVTLRHTAMQAGLKHIEIEVTKGEGEGEKVLVGHAVIAQPTTTVVFTGQGSQEKGMGMDLYATSPVARALWDKADGYFLAQFGVSILDIVRRNPTEIKVRFGGMRGRMLRQNYMSMHYETPATTSTIGGVVGKPERRPMFPEIHERSTSYTHASPAGLLFATQFAQPALTIMEMAVVRDMQAHGVLDTDGCHFAGHSLGEFAALASFTDFMPFENLLYFVFCRGMTMQSAVERDALGRSAFAMAAVDPSRVCKGKHFLLPLPSPPPSSFQFSMRMFANDG